MATNTVEFSSKEVKDVVVQALLDKQSHFKMQLNEAYSAGDTEGHAEALTDMILVTRALREIQG